jgi:hypothetical protein
MQYQTRRLIAAEPMRHDGRELKPGDEFDASEVDARYLVSQLRAREVQDKVARIVAAPVAAPVEPEAPADETKPAEDEAADAPPEHAPADAGKPAAPRGRRASPHTNTGTRRRT